MGSFVWVTRCLGRDCTGTALGAGTLILVPPRLRSTERGRKECKVGPDVLSENGLMDRHEGKEQPVVNDAETLVCKDLAPQRLMASGGRQG